MIEIVLKNNSFQKRLLITCAVFSFLVLLSSFLAQHLWKIEPCRLCKLQQIPYYFLIFIPLIGLITRRYQITKVLILFLFFISLMLSAYHLLVISGIVKDVCVISKPGSIEDFMQTLNSPVPCSKAKWTFLGIPVAGYNFLFSFVFIYFFLKCRFSLVVHKRISKYLF